MNDFTLDSLAKLFALAANRQSEENSDRFVNVFKLFLSAEIEDKFIDDYVDIFVKYLQDFSSASSKKRVSLNSVKLIKICEDIRVNLSITERLIIIYYLIVLIEETGFSDISRAFTELISDMFGISHDLYSNLSDFISNNKGGKYQVLFNDRTRIAEVLITDLDIIFIKPLVNDLKLNDRNIKSDNVVYMLKDSVLVFKDIKKFFYPELYLLAENNKHTGTDKFYLKIRDIELVKKNKQILHKTSVDFCSGELIAVIGKSGSGKTSFLRSVAGLEKKAKGKVYFLGNNSNHVLNKAFVPQNNDFIPLFSVEEHLIHRCDFLQFSSDKLNQMITEVLVDTGLSEERKQIVCKSDKSTYQLSGGQQKRLGIAMELLNQPDVLFLDEPTSGLSSEDSYKIITLLRSIANQNKIIIASIHQPDFNIFMMFDKVLIIDEGGYPIYFGTPAESVDYFRKMLAKVDKNTLIETKYNPAVLLKMIEERHFDENGIAIGQRKMMASDYYQGFINNSRSEIKGDKLQTTKTNKQNNLISFFNQLKFSFSVDLKQ
ncbi:MAG: ATP-binding cassette domain-containing protein, partial [Bacteroidales bacterium]|nr:ATP-binding cassette domain-containing protein [Bacteroidales bacterium]